MESEEKSFGKIIAETAIATLFWLVVGLSLLAALFPIAFPSVSARFYADIDNLPRAYDCAARAARIDKTVDSRKKAVDYAVTIYEKSGATYAVSDCIPAFLTESDKVFEEIDRKNIAALGKEYHPVVRSYRDYLAEVLATVRASEGKTYLFDGENFVGGKIVLSGTPDTLVLVQLTAALSSGLSSDVVIQNYGDADSLIAYARSIVTVPAEGMKPSLDDTYNALVYARFYKSLGGKFSLTEDQIETAKITYGYENLTPDKYYNRLLTGYAA